jgi:uncharacterized protein
VEKPETANPQSSTTRRAGSPRKFAAGAENRRAIIGRLNDSAPNQYPQVMTEDAYYPFEQALAAAGSPLPPAEAHGLLCGLLCAGLPGGIGAVQGRWLEEVAAGGDPAPLHGLAGQTAAALADPELGFAPLLPGDEAPPGLRAQALVDWCQGFLYGFGAGGPGQDLVIPTQSREALRDIVELTRLDVAALEEGETEERELAELGEFLRVAVLLIREERLAIIQQRETTATP